MTDDEIAAVIATLPVAKRGPDHLCDSWAEAHGVKMGCGERHGHTGLHRAEFFGIGVFYWTDEEANG